MSDEQPINPCTIPQFTGDLEALEKDRASLTSAAGTFRDAGANVDTEFQGLSAFYSAPEAAQLFATTNPVRTDSDFFADQLDSAAKALGEYVTEARPIVARLKDLQTKAATFSSKIIGDEHWKDDKEKIDENRDLIHDVNAAVTAFWAAEKTCANKIRALYCAPPLGYDDGSHGANMYGFKLEDLNGSKTLPWGTQFEETHRVWEVDYWAKSYIWDGIIIDGIVGTIKGLGTFVGFQGWDAAGKAWVGLAKLATGVAISTTPFAGPFWLADEKDLPPWLRDSRKAMKETGKALVAWDEWGKNPARAAGAVTFNVVTTVATGGTGSVTKAGTVAKVLAATGKAGRLIDPITYIGKAGSFTKFKVGELFAHFNKADGVFPKIDDVVWKDLPKADVPGVKFPHPDDTVRLLDDALGRPQYYDKTTNQLLDHTGAPKQDLTTVPKGPDHPLAEVPKPERVPAGAGAHTPGGAATHTPHNSHTEPGGGGTGHGGTDTTPTGGHTSGDHTPTGGTHGDGPTGGHDGPSTGGHGDGPGVPHQGGPGDVPSPGDEIPGSGNPESAPPGKVKRVEESWPAGDDIVGTARGKNLLYPNARHNLSGVRSGRVDTHNTIILPETREAVKADLAEIAAGRAKFNSSTATYTVNGRSYGVEPTGRTYPTEGPGLVNLDRVEYEALKAIMRADGDLSKVEVMFSRNPKFSQNPESVQRMIDLYREYYS